MDLIYPLAPHPSSKDSSRMLTRPRTSLLWKPFMIAVLRRKLKLDCGPRLPLTPRLNFLPFLGCHVLTLLPLALGIDSSLGIGSSLCLRVPLLLYSKLCHSDPSLVCIFFR